MAFSTSLFIFCMSGGNDGTSTAVLSGGNGGGFDTGVFGMATDGSITNANTTAPIITTPTYAFINRDVNAKLFIKAGINAYPGWYNINSVSASAATLAASPSGSTLADGSLSPFTGCGSASSLSTVTWSVDYSQQPNPVFIYKDIATSAVNVSGFTSAQFPFANNLVGNIVVISGGLATAQRVAICSISAGSMAIADKTLGVLSASNISGACGGAFASPGMASSIATNGTVLFIKNGFYLMTVTTSRAPRGRIISSGNTLYPMIIRGYDITPGDETALANRPTIRYGINGGSNAMIDVAGASSSILENLVVDGDMNHFTATRGINTGSADFIIRRIKVINCGAVGINIASSGPTVYVLDTEVTSCSGSAAITTATTTVLDGCYIHDNTIDGLSASIRAIIMNSIFANNKLGSAKSGIVGNGSVPISVINSVIYGSGSHGIDMQDSSQGTRLVVINSLFEGNGGFGINAAHISNQQISRLMNNGFYNNTSGNYNTALFPYRLVDGSFNGVGSFFTNAAGGDFSLNSLVNRGQLAVAKGFPLSIVGSNTLIYDDVGVAQHPTRGVSYGNIS